jgi:hypothetical protein
MSHAFKEFPIVHRIDSLNIDTASPKTIENCNIVCGAGNEFRYPIVKDQGHLLHLVEFFLDKTSQPSRGNDRYRNIWPKDPLATALWAGHSKAIVSVAPSGLIAKVLFAIFRKVSYHSCI